MGVWVGVWKKYVLRQRLDYSLLNSFVSELTDHPIFFSMGIIMIIIICKEANKVGIFQSNSRATGSSSSTAAFLGPNPSSSSSSSSSSESTFFSMLYCEKVLEIFLKLQEEPIEYWGGAT